MCKPAFQTAVALACYEAKSEGSKVPEVTEEHFEQVVNMSASFKNYMKSALHGDEAALAYMSGTRNDNFKAPPS